MKKMLVLFAMSAALSAVPAAASAQSGAAEPDARMFVGALGGVTFGTESGAIVGGRFGYRIARNLHLFGEVGRITEVTPKEIADLYEELIAIIPGDLAVEFEYRVPATFFAGGVRWSQARGRIAPFAEAGAGVGHLTPKFDVRIAGINFTQQVRDLIGDEINTTKFLLMLGGGVNVGVTPSLSVDAGYRYTRIATEDPAVNTSAVYGMLVWRIR